jgi:hypothetical protein
MSTDKVWYRSRTVWTSIISGLLMFLSGSQVTTVIPQKYSPYIGAVGFGLNILLRSISTPEQGGLTLTKDAAESVGLKGRGPTQ